MDITSALSAFQEAGLMWLQRRTLAPLERRYEKATARFFKRQGRATIKQLRFLRGRFDKNAIRESISPGEWAYLLDMALFSASAQFEETSALYVASALSGGAKDLASSIGGISINFDLENPRAEAYAEQQAGELIKQINDTTRDYINAMIVDAVQNGTAWTELADKISKRFDDMTRGRAERVARYELRDAYEAGNEIGVGYLEAAGLVIEKKWSTVGDALVRPEHRRNQGQGWIAMSKKFQSGHKRPPTDPGCRCTLLYRRVEV